jgi:hypothetical protein
MRINHVTHQTNIGGAIASNAPQGIIREPLSRERLEDLQKLALSNSEKLANILRLDTTSALFDRPIELLTRIQNATTLLVESVDFAKKYNFGAVNFLHYSQITELLVKLGEKKEFLTEGPNLFSYLELVVKNAKANLSVYDGKERNIVDKEKAMENVVKLLKVIENLKPDSQITEFLIKFGENKEFLKIRLNLFSYLELVVENAKANLSIYDGNERNNADKEEAIKNVGKLLKVIESLEPDIKAANLSADLDSFGINSLKSRFLNCDLLPNNRIISSSAARYIKII